MTLWRHELSNFTDLTAGMILFIHMEYKLPFRKTETASTGTTGAFH